MTEITFHFNVPESLGYCCRLLRKAFLKGASVAVTGDAEPLAELDASLWALGADEFIPHCLSNASATTLSATPVVLCASLSGVDRHEVLVNLGQAVPAEFERFERLIEFVTTDEADRLAARQRWKHYASRGYVLNRHEVSSAH